MPSDAPLRRITVPLSLDLRGVLVRHFDSLVLAGYKDHLAFVLFREKYYSSLSDHKKAKVCDYAVRSLKSDSLEENFRRIEPEFRQNLSQLLSGLGAGSEFEPAYEKFLQDAVAFSQNPDNDAFFESAPGEEKVIVRVPVNLRRTFLESSGLGDASDEELEPILSAYIAFRLFYRFSSP